MIKTYTSIPSVNEDAILNVIIFAPNNEEDIKGMIQVLPRNDGTYGQI